MALPIRPPQGGLPTNKPTAPSAPADEVALPALPVLPEIPSTLKESPQTKKAAPAKSTQKSSTPTSAKEAQSPRQEKLDPRWTIDPVTGKKYKKIAGFKEGVLTSKAAISKAANGGMTLEQLRMTVIEEPDLNLDDLNGSAETFLAHLRVPPDKEEQKRLRAMREEREKIYEAAARRAAEEEAAREAE